MKHYDKNNKKVYKELTIKILEDKMKNGSITFGERMELQQLKKDYPF